MREVRKYSAVSRSFLYSVLPHSINVYLEHGANGHVTVTSVTHEPGALNLSRKAISVQMQTFFCQQTFCKQPNICHYISFLNTPAGVPI